MAQITVHHPGRTTRPARAGRQAPADRHVDVHRDGSLEDLDRDPHETLRSVVPVSVAFALLLGVVVVAGFVLRDLLDLGVWFLSAQ